MLSSLAKFIYRNNIFYILSVSDMEYRKVQMTGGSSFIVSLPKRWATNVGIKVGDELGIIEHEDGKLTISPRSHEITSEKKINIDPSLPATLLERLIVASYLAGYDLINIKSVSRITPEQRGIISGIARKLIGPEIVEESNDSILIQDILNSGDLSVKKAIKRMHMIVSSMQKDVIHALKVGDVYLARDVIQRDDDVDRLYLLIVRQLVTSVRHPVTADNLKIKTTDTLDLRIVAKSLERIGDHAEKIGSVICEDSLKLPPHVVDPISNMNEFALYLHREAMKALFKEDFKLANQIIEREKEIYKIKEEILEELLYSDDACIMPMKIALITESLERIANYGTDIAEIAINQSIKE